MTTKEQETKMHSDYVAEGSCAKSISPVEILQTVPLVAESQSLEHKPR